MVSTIENAEAIAPKRISPRSRQIDLGCRGQCEALYKAERMPKQIADSISIGRTTIFQWVNRYGWKKSRAKARQILQKGVPATIAERLARRAEELKDRCSQEVVELAALLENNPARTIADLVGGKGQKSRPEIVNTMLDAAEKVFGWKNKQDGQGCLVQIGTVERLCPDTLKEKWAKPVTAESAPRFPRKDV